MFAQKLLVGNVTSNLNPSPAATYNLGDGVSSYYSHIYANFFNTVSDGRLKKDIANSPYGLAEVLKLRPVTYRLKSGPDDVQVGLIAQEVQKVVPEAVSKGEGEQGTFSINYMALVPVLVRGAQEQQKVLQDQEARIASLERSRGPVAASLFGVNDLMMGFALGLLPFAWVVARRRKG